MNVGMLKDFPNVAALASGVEITDFFYDDFSDSVFPAASDSPGWVGADSISSWSEHDGVLHVKGSANAGNDILGTKIIPMLEGRCVEWFIDNFVDANKEATTSLGALQAPGWFSHAGNLRCGHYHTPVGQSHWWMGSNLCTEFTPYMCWIISDTDISYKIRAVWLDTGAMIFVQHSDFPSNLQPSTSNAWMPVSWTNDSWHSTGAYLNLESYSAEYYINYVHAFDPSPVNNPSPLVEQTDQDAESNIALGTDDVLVIMQWQHTAGEPVWAEMRRQDSDNYIRIGTNSDSETGIWKVVGGTPTSVMSSGDTLITGNNYQMVGLMAGAGMAMCLCSSDKNFQSVIYGSDATWENLTDMAVFCDTATINVNLWVYGAWNPGY